MNVAREIDKANERIQKQIEDSARAALIRIGVDPDEVAREEAEAKRQATLNIWRAYGRACGEVAAAVSALAGAFAEGFTSRAEA